MSCTNCSDNNSVPLPVGVTDPCNPCTTPCTNCQECDCDCDEPGYMLDGCFFTANSSCLTYDGDNLPCPDISTGDTLTSVISSLATYTKNIVSRITSDSLVVAITDDDCDDKATIELVPSTDADNALVLGGDGKPYVPAVDLSGIVSPTLVANDSSTIDFMSSGTIGHTITAAVKISATANNILTNSTGLFVDGAALEVPLTFNNGLTRTSNTVKLGGTLLADTSINGGVFNFSLQHTGTGNNFDYFSKDFLKIIREDVTYNTTMLLAKGYWNAQVSDPTDYSSGAGYYTRTYINLTNSGAILGFGIPATNGSPAPANDPLVTSYFKATTGVNNIYGSKTSIVAPVSILTSGSLTSGRRYVILTAGGTFNLSGAANNAVGTVFTANATVPVWSTGSLQLLGEINHVTGNSDYSSAFAQNDYSTALVHQNTVADLSAVSYVRGNLYVTELSTVTDRAGTAYLAVGEVSINNGSGGGTAYTRIGHSVPTTLDPGISAAPSNDPATTSYIQFSDAATRFYSANVAVEGGIIIRPQDTATARQASAALEVKSTVQGFLPPKMTAAQKGSISSPAEGLMIYQTDGGVGVKGVWVYDGSAWRRLTWA